MDNEKKRKLEDGAVVGTGSEELETSVRRIAALLPHDKIVDILVNAAMKYESVAEEVQSLANKDQAQRKLFVRGVAWETTSETLCSGFDKATYARAHKVFAEYGEIEEGGIATDRQTGRSRGFGFITFKDVSSVSKALQEPNKTIDGRVTVCNLAAAGSAKPAGGADAAPERPCSGSGTGFSSARTIDPAMSFIQAPGPTSGGMLPPGTVAIPVPVPVASHSGLGASSLFAMGGLSMPGAGSGPSLMTMGMQGASAGVLDGRAGPGTRPGGGDVALRKLFVKGVPFAMGNAEFLGIFAQWGEIEEGSIAFDKNTHKSRGFGFVTYRTAEAAARALLEPVKQLGGREVVVKYAAHEGKGSGSDADWHHHAGATPSIPGFPQQGAASFSPFFPP